MDFEGLSVEPPHVRLEAFTFFMFQRHEIGRDLDGLDIPSEVKKKNMAKLLCT